MEAYKHVSMQLFNYESKWESKYVSKKYEIFQVDKYASM